ncbi:SAM-dependent methyltransferase [Pseudonocardia yunnanensis]
MARLATPTAAWATLTKAMSTRSPHGVRGFAGVGAARRGIDSGTVTIVVAASAHWIAAARARESRREDALFIDVFAADLAGDLGFTMMARSEDATGQENSYIPVRVRWFDDAVLAATSGRIDQVVLLGAGLDTRPFRLDVPHRVRWFEVDRAEVLARKQQILGETPSRCDRRVVTADLRDEWIAPLKAAGFEPSLPTAWIAEGLFFYLGEAGVHSLLGQVAGLSAAGSRLLADIMGAAGLNGPAMQPYRDHCASHGLPPPFGSDDPVGMLEAAGWHPETIAVPGAPGANYGRLPPVPEGPISGATHFVVAYTP